MLNIPSISAVLMQIRLAISNLEPKPARLASDWNRSAFVGLVAATSLPPSRPYGIDESLVGYKRAAATHGWTVRTSFFYLPVKLINDLFFHVL